MADKKISELTSAGALAGTEVLPIVQSGETKKLALNAITTLGTIATGTWQGTQIANAYVATLTAAGKVANSATTATNANTASAIVARDASGNFSAGTITAALTGNVTGNVSGSSGSTTGNAATATTLQTARNINGVSFNGSADITVTAAAGTLTGSTLASGVTASSLTSVGTLTNLTVTNPITGSVTGSSGSTTGNAATATALQTARTINGVSFDGTANITVPAAAGTLTGSTLASGVTASSLTSVGTLTSLAVSGNTTLNGVAYTWPATAGTNAYVLATNGSGTLSWVAQTGGGGGGGTTTFPLTAGSFLTGGTFDGSSAVTFAVDATSANTASKVVARDASGNFSAGAVTATSIVVSGTTSLNGVAYTWPASAGTNGQVLATNGAGTLSWVTGGGGGGGGTTTFPLTAGTYLTGGTFDGSAAVTFAVDATSTNTVSKVVARDANGDFAARIATLGALQLDSASPAPAGVGRIIWNNTDGVPEVRLLGGNVDLAVGENNVARVLNDTGSPLTYGQIVYITGASGQRATVALANAATEATSTNVIGFVAEAIANNQEGFVRTSGTIKGLNTNAFNQGDLLYLSATTAGAFTNVRPTQPNHGVRVGYVIKKNSVDGHIFIDVNNGYEFEELHDVLITTPAANNMIRRNAGNTLWVNIAGPAGDVVGTTDSQTLTNKTISGASNTLSNIGNGSLTNSSVTVNGTSIALGASGTVTAAAGTLTGTTLASNVVSSSLTSVGTIATGVWNGTAISDTYLATISTAGKVSNSATTAASANTASAIVARDASGNFSAGTITAALTGNASTATTLQTARNINGVSFNGSADITVTAAASTLSGTTLASGVTASSLTSVGTLSALTMGGTVSMVDNIISRPRFTDYAETYTTPAISSGTLTLNLENGNVFRVSRNANITTLTISNPAGAGNACSFTLIFDANGTSYTITWPAAVKWPAGTAPTITTTASRSDMFVFYTNNAGTTWYAMTAAQNFVTT